MEQLELEEIYLNLKKIEDKKKEDEDIKNLIFDICKKKTLEDIDKAFLNKLFDNGFLNPDETMNIFIWTASYYGSLCTLKLFKERGCDLTARNNKALEIAINNNHNDVNEFLCFNE